VETVNVDKEELLLLMRRAGFVTQRAFAQAVGLSSPKLTNILNGNRRAQASEAQRMAAVLKLPVATVLRVLDSAFSSPEEGIHKVLGIVADPDNVAIYEENDPNYGLIELFTPFALFVGEFFVIHTDVLAPRYIRDEFFAIPAIGEVFVPHERLAGEDVLAKVKDGPIVLRTLHPGSAPNRATLLSLTDRSAPMFDVLVEWVEPILFRLPRNLAADIFR
jgi:transcriptional regulator with XRE-family HTH domain